jgi:hypothetical protein
MKAENISGEEGQAAVLITILLMFALVALTALAIDGGHLYVVRRDLQNMADAACLAAATELSLHGTTDEAYNTAVEYILANGGTEELYTPQDGDGIGLVKGIQVSGADVRVALQELVDTYFTMIFNRSGALVGARSHCNATAAGGLMPIAVRRFEYNEEQPGLQLDLLANKKADPRNPAAPCHDEGDCAYYADSAPVTLHGRYGPMTVYLPKPGYTPGDGSIISTDSGNIDCDVPPRDGVYIGACVLGDGVPTNDGTADYKGFVLLDVRNIVPGPIEYYNGATGQADTNKEISKQWFRAGYPGPQPMVGDQLAMLDGVSNDFAAQEMAKYWEVEDEFVAIVYSGYIWDIPDLEVSIEPVVNSISPTFPSITDTVSYLITLDKVGPSPWKGDANFELEWYFMEHGGAHDVITPTVEFSRSTVILPQTQGSVSVTMTVYAENPITTTNYLSALTVRAREVVLGLKRWASTNFRYGDITDPDFTMYADRLEFNVPQGGSLDIPLTTRGFGFAQNNASVNAYPAGAWAWDTVFSSSQSDRIRIRDGLNGDSTFTLKVKDDAMPGWYTVRLTASPAGAPPHSVEIAVNVYVPTAGGEPSRFVIVEGFAPFRVSYKDSNTIGAYAIGPIVQNLDDVISGLNPRLLPWGTP